MLSAIRPAEASFRAKQECPRRLGETRRSSSLHAEQPETGMEVDAHATPPPRNSSMRFSSSSAQSLSVLIEGEQADSREAAGLQHAALVQGIGVAAG